MNDCLISIITVCYNSEKTIMDTLESMLHQTYLNFEYIIIDGKSTDSTMQIIDSYRDKFGPKLKVISEKDKGIYDAMNKGVSYASGDLIGMINSDDWYEEDALENVANEYQRQNLAVFYGMQKLIQNEKEKICWLKHHQFLDTQMITFPTCFITKGVYEKFGNYDLQYRSSADYDFILKLFKSGEVDFISIYKVIAAFRLGGMSATNIGNIETAKIRHKYGIISKRQCNNILIVQYCKIYVKKILKKLGLRKK